MVWLRRAMVSGPSTGHSHTWRRKCLQTSQLLPPGPAPTPGQATPPAQSLTAAPALKKRRIAGPGSSKSSSTLSSNAGLLHPKAWARIEPEPDLVSENARLLAENTQLKNKLAFADEKVKALAIFASKYDKALWLLREKLGTMSAGTSILDGVDNVVAELRGQFPSLEGLITYHEDPVEMRETAGMAQWVAQHDHVQMGTELQLRKGA